MHDDDKAETLQASDLMQGQSYLVKIVLKRQDAWNKTFLDSTGRLPCISDWGHVVFSIPTA